MAFSGVNFFSAVLLVSKDAERLASFYKNILGVPLEDEQHGEAKLHYGCELGDLHFAIHPTDNFEGESPGVGSVKLAFEVFDIDSFVQEMAKKNVDVLYAPKQMGPMRITAIKDPDGNLIEFTQLGKRWVDHLEKRRKDGQCVIERWKQVNVEV